MNLKAKIHSKDATVAVIGLGYVGLPVCIAYAEAGLRVIGIDVDRGKVDGINAGRSHVFDVEDETVARFVKKGNLVASADFDSISSADAVIICVPTPLSKTKEPDLTYLVSAVTETGKRIRPGMLVVLESTSYPGTTEEVALPILASGSGSNKNLEVGKDFFLAFSPERIDPGRTDWTLKTTPKVVGGITAECLEVARALYETAVDTVVPVRSARTAEMVKLLENTYRAVNIALVNEVAIMCARLEVDVWDVIAAASSKPFGYQAFYPGPGLGGHCIPVDPQYSAWKLKMLDYEPRFIQLATEINQSMPRYVVERISELLNDQSKPVRGSKILVLGVAYKRDTPDSRESPAVDIIDGLCKRGAIVQYHDPFVPELEVEETLHRSVPIDIPALESADCVVIVTDHSDIDWVEVVEHSRLLLDTRNVTRGIDEESPSVSRL